MHTTADSIILIMNLHCVSKKRATFETV